jgi:hypothetical protein
MRKRLNKIPRNSEGLVLCRTLQVLEGFRDIGVNSDANLVDHYTWFLAV